MTPSGCAKKSVSEPSPTPTSDRRNAERQIQLQTNRALEQIRREAVDLSVMIASKIIQRNLSKEDNERLIDDGAQAGRGPRELASARARVSTTKKPRELAKAREDFLQRHRRLLRLLLIAALRLRRVRSTDPTPGTCFEQRQRLVEPALPEPHHSQQEPDRRPIGLQSHRDLQRVAGRSRRSPASIWTTPRSRWIAASSSCGRARAANSRLALSEPPRVVAFRRAAARVDHPGERRHANAHAPDRRARPAASRGERHRRPSRRTRPSAARADCRMAAPFAA